MSGARMREEYLAVDPPGAVRPDQDEEVGVAGAAPILRLQPGHRGGAAVFDGDDARFEIGGRPTLRDGLAEFLQRPGDRLAAIAAAHARALGEGRPQEPRVAVSGAVDIALQRGGDCVLGSEAFGLVGKGRLRHWDLRGLGAPLSNGSARHVLAKWGIWRLVTWHYML